MALLSQFASLRQNSCILKHNLLGTPTGKELGRGTYGSIEEVSVQGIDCVGKKFHENLFANTSTAQLTSKYIQECTTLSDVRHPNIVQFLGLCFTNDYPLPILLTEKLEGSLHCLLEIVPNIPMILKQSMLEDIARGLHYLHTFSPTIIHGDLTLRNVLYTSSLVAKISDVSNCRLVELQNSSEQSQLILPAESRVYMPPESNHQDNPQFDIFSFGHISLCILTQVFSTNFLDHAQNCSAIKSRTEYFQKAERELPDNPFLTTVRECLHNEPEHRPSAAQLLTSLEELKTTSVACSHSTFTKTNAVRWILSAHDIVQMEQESKKNKELYRTTLEQSECKDRVIQELGATLKLKDTEASKQTETEPKTSDGLEATAETSNLKDMELKLLYGYVAQPRLESTSEGYTHDWTAFVRGVDNSDIKNVIEKVTFHLHEDYEPHAKRVVKEPPYEVSESGFGTFNLQICIDFTNKEVLDIEFNLLLYDFCDVSTVLKQAVLFQLSKRSNLRFKEKLLQAGGRPCTYCPAIHGRIQPDKKRIRKQSKVDSKSRKKTKLQTDSKKTCTDKPRRRKPTIVISDSDSSDDKDTNNVVKLLPVMAEL